MLATLSDAEILACLLTASGSRTGTLRERHRLTARPGDRGALAGIIFQVESLPFDRNPTGQEKSGDASMTCSVRHSGLLAQAVACGLSGGLLAQALSLHPWWWTAWVAPVPVLIVALDASPARRRLMGFAIGLFGGASGLAYVWTTSESLAAVVLVLVLRGLSWMWLVTFSARIIQRYPPAIAVLALPTAASGLDVVVAALSPHGSAGSLAYSQVDFLPALQAAALGGTPLVVFMVLLPSSAVAVAVFAATRSGRWTVTGWSALVPAAAVLGVLLTYGGLRLAQAHDPLGPSVALLSADDPARPADWETFWRTYSGPMRAAAPGTTVVLPESSLRLSAAESDLVTTRLAGFARQHHVDLVVGILVEGDDVSNRALVVTSSGTRRWYEKRHLVPGLESGITPGSGNLVVPQPVSPTGVAVCKDMHFAALGAEYARAGVRLMVVPAFDFTVDGSMSARMTAVRGIEGGYTIARATRTGHSMVSDRWGRMLAEQASTPTPSALTARVPVPAADTPLPPYQRGGWLFGWLCLLTTIAAALQSRSAQPRRASARRREPSIQEGHSSRGA